jgi:hypothetical protein
MDFVLDNMSYIFYILAWQKNLVLHM